LKLEVVRYQLKPTINQKLSEKGRYYCPMFCEGDKTYPENVGCPVCGMDLVKITGNDDESEDDTYKNLKKSSGFP
jgi:Cu2+-exporting ATPase